MPNGLVTRRRAAAATLVIAGLLTAACGGDDTTTEEPAEAAEEQAATQEPADQETSDSSAAEEPGEEAAAEGLCATVVSVDLFAAFGNTMEFGEPSDVTGREACVVPIEGAEGEGLIVQVTTEDNYQAKRAFEEQGVPFTEIDGLGAEAFIVNEADLNVLLEDGSAVNVGISAFFVQNDLPPAETLQEGLTAVAEAVVAGQ